MSEAQRNRIAETMLSMKDLARGYSLDDTLSEHSPIYREDMPGPIERIDQMLKYRPMAGPEIDPRMAPAPSQMLGIEPTNDRAVFDPDILPGMNEPSNYGYRA
jgi:hypothetical protein